MIQVADNFNLRVSKPLDNRLVSARLANLVALNDYELYDGMIAFAQDRKSWYTYYSGNTVDSTYGKWRPFATNGIQSAVINSDGELVLTFDGGITSNVGKVVGDKGDTGDPFTIKKTYTRDTTDGASNYGFQEVLTDYTAMRIADGNIVVLQSNTYRDGTTGTVSNLYLVNGDTTEAAEADTDADLYNQFRCNLAKLKFLFAFSDVTTIKGDTGETGPQGPKGNDGETPAVSTEAAAATTEYPGGGTIVHFDYLDTTLSKEFTVWNGNPGKDGDTPTFTVSDITADSDHPNGGQEIEITLGSNVIGNISLYNGLTSLFTLTAIEASTDHPAGGTKVDITTGSETKSFNLYNGEDGVTTEIELEEIAASSEHLEGGTKMTITTGTTTKTLEVYNGITPVVTIDDIAADTTHLDGGEKITVTTGTDTKTTNIYNGNTPQFTLTDIAASADHPAGGTKISINNGKDTPTEFEVYDGNDVRLSVETLDATTDHTDGGYKFTLKVNDEDEQEYEIWNGNTPTITVAAVADTDEDAASYPNGGYRVTFNKGMTTETEYVVTHGITPVFTITDITSGTDGYPDGGVNVKITTGDTTQEYNLKNGHTPEITIETITDEDGVDQQNWFVDGTDTGVRAYGSVSLNSNPEISEEITTNITVGAAPAGTTFANKTTLTQIAKKILVAEVIPNIEVTLSYAKLQEVGTSQATTDITAKVMNINDINVEVTSLVFYIDDTIIEEKTWDGTTTTYTSQNADATTATTNYKVVIKYKDFDGNDQTYTIDNIVKFVNPTYVGVLSAAPTTSDQITGLSKSLIDGVESAQTYNTAEQMMIYATTGTVSTIISTETGFHLDWEVTDIEIDSVTYHVWHSIICGVSNFEVTFA